MDCADGKVDHLKALCCYVHRNGKQQTLHSAAVPSGPGQMQQEDSECFGALAVSREAMALLQEPGASPRESISL